MEAALIRELDEELGAETKIAGFAGAVEHGYIEDGTTHHELNLVFDVTINDTEPISQEDHLEFHWLPPTSRQPRVARWRADLPVSEDPGGAQAGLGRAVR